MFTPLRQLLPHAAARYGLTRQTQAAAVCEHYRRVAQLLIHPEALAHTKPLYFRRSILTIGIENGAWAQVVHRGKSKLLQELNARAKGISIKDIRTKITQLSAAPFDI